MKKRTIITAIIALALIGCGGDPHTHTWGAWEVTKAPTATAEGIETRECTDCGKTDTRPIAQLIAGVDYPIEQGGTGEEITDLFGKGYKVTVSGNMLNSEWDGVVDNIETAIKTRYNDAPDFAQDVFAKGVMVIVEVSPTGYTDWKTTGDGKTIYISLAATNGTSLADLIEAAVASVSGNGTSTGDPPPTQNYPATPVELSFGSVTMQGVGLTATEWADAQTAIVTKFNAAYNTDDDGKADRQFAYETEFRIGINIILEKNPNSTDYNNYKKTERILYINVDKIGEVVDIDTIILAFMGNSSIIAKATPQYQPPESPLRPWWQRTVSGTRIA